MMKNIKNKLSSFELNKMIITVLVLLMAGVILTVRMTAFDYFKISGSSMQPTLDNKEYVFINRLKKNDVKRGDVIIFKAEGNNIYADKGTYYVKRIIATEGDTVEKKENGDILVNGKVINQDYLIDASVKSKTPKGKVQVEEISAEYEKTEGTSGPEGPMTQETWDLEKLSKDMNWNPESKNQSTVPSGRYFVLGDHRSKSADSRAFGFVDSKSVVGVVRATPFASKERQHILNEVSSEFYE